MMNSNIVAGSNVFLSRTDDPRYDPLFVAQIYDEVLLRDLKNRRETDREIPALSKEQMAIVHKGIRCTFAKKDPCFGYIEGIGTKCKCINIDCPGIHDLPSFWGQSPWKGCNPDVTEEYVKEWTQNPKDNELYGNPDDRKRLPKYYLVDMISDEEMSKYKTDPVNSGYVYSVSKNPVLSDREEDNKKERKTRIDPETGRKMVVVGYRWVFADNASYEQQELVPIWDFVEEVEEKKNVIRKKSKKIEKKQTSSYISPKSDPISDQVKNVDYSRKEEFEKAVSDNIVGEIKLTDINEDSFSSNTVVLLDNPAELAFVSNTFLVSQIMHSIHSDLDVKLALVDDYDGFSKYEHIMVSSSVLKRGCKESNTAAWKALAQRNDIVRINIAAHDFHQFIYEDGKRWTCRNMYGVTHVCVDIDDVKELNKLDDGVYPISIVGDKDSFEICEKNGEPVGYLKKDFADLIRALRAKGEISGTLAVIDGLSLMIVEGRAEILGMGHLRFVEY